MTKSAASVAQRNLGLGYALPIIGGVTALLLGLIISDITRTNLDIWIWVLIHAILGAGAVLGTRFATSAYNFGLAHRKKLGATKGARNLNLVLGIIWGAVVTIVSFVKSSEAVNRLVEWPKYTGKPLPSMTDKAQVVEPTPTIHSLGSAAFLENFLPAFVLVLIAVVGIYLLVVERGREAE